VRELSARIIFSSHQSFRLEEASIVNQKKLMVSKERKKEEVCKTLREETPTTKWTGT